MINRVLRNCCIILLSGCWMTSSWAEENPYDYWAFKPVDQDVAIPKVSDPAWASNPIDAIIHHGLSNAGLTPVPPADKDDLIRRAYYDLTGLPPTPEQVKAFVANESPDAYERVIDDLLASTQYGEKWARHWLDLVRYADSNGYERDSNKPEMWRYRDYVIDSFNADKPYDQFIREQLAGDELEPVTPETMTATGYYRLGTWDDEPADPEQNKFDELDDIVRTTSEVFLGLTVGCARCHDHKIDPITQKDYYRFLSFFHNIKPLTRTKDFGILRSIMNAEEQTEYDTRFNHKQRRENQALSRQNELLESFMAKAKQEHPEWFEGSDTRLSDITQLTYKFYRDTWEALPDFDMIKVEDSGEVAHNYISLSTASRQTAIGFVFEGKLLVPEDGTYTFFAKVNDGIRLKVGNYIVLEQKGIGEFGPMGTLQLKKGLHPIRVDYFTKDGPPRLVLLWEGPGVKRRSLSLDGVEKAPKQDKLLKLVKEHGTEVLGAEEAALFDTVQEDLKKIRAVHVPMKQAAAVSEYGHEAPDTFIMVRGNPHTPGEKVEPGFPLALSPPKFDLPVPSEERQTTYRRTAMADWIASPGNPMTARVMANRIWQHHFGRGIVRSASDMGKLGDRPTHPELLDWLAAELIDGDWKLKSLHKKIMLSQTYRMSSEANEKALVKDPANDLFWRFDMRRLTAEEVRDSMLMASGSLNRKSFGPTIFPKLPDEVLATSSKKADIVSSGIWGISTPEEANRRSVYIHQKRSLKHPMLSTFDFADIDSTCPVRFVTTQPAQALNLLNSTFAHEQARLLKARIEQEHASDLNAQLTRAFELCAGRVPTAQEQEMSHRFLSEMQSNNDLTPDQALERYCLLALNLNEFIYLD